MIYAVFGDQELNVVSYWSGLAITEKINLAEQRMIEGKPALQYVGSELDTLKITLHWHISFCDPQTELDLLRARMASTSAYPLVMGSGLWLGYFVVKSISIDVQNTDALGTLHQITVTADLVEYAAPPKPIAIRNPPAVTSSSNPAARRPRGKGAAVSNIDSCSSSTITRKGKA